MTMLLPSINKQFGGMIWRLEIDSNTDTIFLEIRDGADKKVSFSSIDILSGQINFTDITTPERWLTGIEAAYNGILLLHNYQSESAPMHKAVIAINNKGEECWSNYTYAFDHLTVNGPILYNTQIQPRKLFLADIKTGTTIRAYQVLIDKEPEHNLALPEIIQAGTIGEYLPVQPHENIIHYLEYNNFRIVSLHSLKAGQLKQHLFIISGIDLVYEDLLNTDIQKMQPESFILYKNSLVYIKNKSELKVINL